LLFSKVDLRAVALIRPERKFLESDSIPTDPEEVENKKKHLVSQLCRLFNTQGTSLEREDLISILNLSKSLIHKTILAARQ
jgi:hypothetical protein